MCYGILARLVHSPPLGAMVRCLVPLLLLVVGCRCDGRAKDGGELFCGSDAVSKGAAEIVLNRC